MPVLLAPLLIIGAALLSFLALYIYEQLFGSPLDGLARSVPVVGGYIARGVDAAVRYGKNMLSKYVVVYVDKLVDYMLNLARSVEGFAESVNAYLVELPHQLDHLAHVTVHEIVHAFVNPIRDLAHSAEQDATDALHAVGTLNDYVDHKLGGIEGDVKSSIDHAVDVLRNVDLPDFLDTAERFAHRQASAVAGDVDELRDWAGGWVDDLLGRLESIPTKQLLEGAAAGTAALALAQVIANEAGLSRAECRAKVKGICATDPRAWEQLLALAVATFAFPSLRDLVEVAGGIAAGMHDVIREVGAR